MLKYILCCIILVVIILHYTEKERTSKPAICYYPITRDYIIDTFTFQYELTFSDTCGKYTKPQVLDLYKLRIITSRS